MSKTWRLMPLILGVLFSLMVIWGVSEVVTAVNDFTKQWEDLTTVR